MLAARSQKVMTLLRFDSSSAVPVEEPVERYCWSWRLAKIHSMHPGQVDSPSDVLFAPSRIRTYLYISAMARS